MGAIACDEDLPGAHVRILLRKSEIRSRVMPEKTSQQLDTVLLKFSY